MRETPAPALPAAARVGLASVVRRLEPRSGRLTSPLVGIRKKQPAPSAGQVSWQKAVAGERGLPAAVVAFMNSNVPGNYQPPVAMEQDPQPRHAAAPPTAGAANGAEPQAAPAAGGQCPPAALPHLPYPFTASQARIGASTKNPADPKHPKPAPLKPVVWHGPVQVSPACLPEGVTAARPNKILTPDEHMVGKRYSDENGYTVDGACPTHAARLTNGPIEAPSASHGACRLHTAHRAPRHHAHRQTRHVRTHAGRLQPQAGLHPPPPRPGAGVRGDNCRAEARACQPQGLGASRCCLWPQTQNARRAGRPTTTGCPSPPSHCQPSPRCWHPCWRPCWRPCACCAASIGRRQHGDGGPRGRTPTRPQTPERLCGGAFCERGAGQSTVEEVAQRAR